MTNRILACLVAGLCATQAVPAFAQASASPHTYATRYDAARRVVGTIAPDADGVAPLSYKAVRNTYMNGDLIRVETGELASWQAETVAPSAWTGFTVHRQLDYAYNSDGHKIRETVVAGGTTQSVVQYTSNGLGLVVCTAVRMNPAAFASLPADACTLGTPGTHGPDRITRTNYADSRGRIANIKKAVGTPLEQTYASYTYTADRNIASVTDANGGTAQYEYDTLGRRVKWRFPSKVSAGVASTTDFEQYTYDGNSNRISLRKRDGQTISYTYDALNRVTVKDIPGGSATDVYYGYDNRNLQLFARFGSTSGEGVTSAYDNPGRLTSSTTNMGGTSRALTYQYDAHGNRTRVTHPDANYSSYEYDGLDRMTTVRENGGLALAVMSYNAKDELTSRTGPATSQAYSYDAISRLTGIVQDLAGNPGDLTTTMAYNPASQIVTRARSNDAFVFSGDYNVSRNYRVNGLNQYLSAGPAAFTYDDNGNLTSDGGINLAYDAENRLLSASGARSATLSYDPLGRLFQTVGGGVTTQFLYDGDELVGEYGGSGTLLRRYVHGVGVDDPLVWYEGASIGANRRYLHADHQGSVIAVADSGGTLQTINSYSDWGIANATNQGRFQYTGQIIIPEIGFYHYKARIYSPTLGRFLQTDPVGYDDQVNLYAYVGNDPVNARDPTGKVAVVLLIPPAVEAAAAVGGMVAAFFGAGEVTKAVLNNEDKSGATKPEPGSGGKGTGNTVQPSGGRPALKGDPNHPAEVDKRRSQTREVEGAPSKDPDSPIPDRGPGSDQGGHEARGRTPHETGERNVNSNEEHSRRPKGNPTGRQW